MKKILKFWAPVGIIFGLTFLAGFFNDRLNGVELGHLIKIVRATNLIIFGLSYYLTFLFTKNRNHGLWFLLLYALAFAWPSLIEKSEIIYNIFSLVSVLETSWLAIMLYFGFDWFNKQKQTQELEKKNLQSELSMLKNQINPHFLFNTLNNIDSLIKKNPDYASKSIIELSDMMRYMIYETNVEKIPLKKELEYIDNYMALQKLQYFNDDLVEYTITGNPENIEVAPMLFIPFIENAFKHCTNKETKHAIRFSFLLDAEKICFEATNIADKTQSISKDNTSGIGLDTVKRRLEILYPHQYSLEIQEKNDLFCVSLMIKIND